MRLHRRGEARVEGVRHRTTEDVDHHRPVRHRIRIAERQIENRAQVLLELARHRAVLRPVTAVVRTHRELVHQHPLVDGLEQLDGEHAGDIQSLCDPDADPRGHFLQARVLMRRRRDDLGAHAVFLHRLDHRRRAHLARRPTRHLLRELAREVHELLDQERSAVGVFGERREPVISFGGGRHDAHALAVVPAARRLHDGAAAMGVEESLQLVAAGHRGPVGLRHAELGQPRAHLDLVLRESQSVRTRTHGHAGIDESTENVLRHVLVVEGDHIDLAREGQHGLRVAVVPDRGHGELRRHPLGLGEHPQLDPQLHRGRDHHPRQLSATDHTDTQGHPAPSDRSILSHRRHRGMRRRITRGPAAPAERRTPRSSASWTAHRGGRGSD